VALIGDRCGHLARPAQDLRQALLPRRHRRRI